MFRNRPLSKNFKTKFCSLIPELLCDADYLRLWFLQDDEYKLPKAVTKISITTPMVAHDPKTTLLSNLWIWCFTVNLDFWK